MCEYAFFRLLKPLLLIGCLVSAGCGPARPRVSYDYDPTVNFLAFKRYAWADEVSRRRPEDSLAQNSLLDDRIKSALQEQLLFKGLRLDSSQPDFLVTYRLVTQRQRVRRYEPWPYYGPFYGFGYYGSPWYYEMWGMPVAYWEEYETQALVVDFLHPATCKLVWRGVIQIQDVLDSEGDPTTQRYRLGTKLQYLLLNFPPSLPH